MSDKRNERRKIAKMLSESDNDNWLVLRKDEKGIHYYSPSVNNLSLIGIYINENNQVKEYMAQFSEAYNKLKEAEDGDS